MRKVLLSLLMGVLTVSIYPQRVIDKLDRGVVAVNTTDGVFVSWRIQSDEYYDVTYNLYRDGSLIAEGLNTSNYTDASGNTSSSYTIEAVKCGVKQAMSAAATPWNDKYLEITPNHSTSITSTLIPNDACCADVDGDGQVEILLKYDNLEEINNLFPKAGNNGEYTILEVLKLDGSVLWWVNCGPNMGDFQNNEQNIVGYDWDMDGKAEVLMRLEEGSVIHMADGTTYTIGADGKNGTSWTNYRTPKTGGTEWFTCYGKEFLVYCNGQTGVPYQIIDFPCARFERGESDLKSAWGDGYGHRASKFFFGAPYLDGRKPSIFVGRGIYTRHKFVALDVDSATHQLTERWRWMNNQAGSPWFGQGYHNYAIVDVDWDGRDEIVWGSMVIDDNGKGLSTTGLSHGDAQHHGDFNPYVHGQEGFFCNESQPANNYRDLTTSKLYYRVAASGDDGRAIAGNFLNTVPGAVGFSAHDTPPVSLVENKHLDILSTTDGIAQNFRCYWDGDLLEETFNYRNGKNTEGVVLKPGSNISWVLEGSMTNNDTKGTPCFMGDILGDWREEFIMRTADNKIRIYTTTIPTAWRNYSLWYDHQYRNGMVWEMCGYNQPPHVSYFLGELEGITVAPPALTMEGRREINNGGTISNNGEEVITCEPNDMTITISDGASPYLYIDNAPSWVQGSAPSEATTASYAIKYDYYVHTLQGGGFTGSTRVVKQGDGILVYPECDMTYSGHTDVWAGTLNLNGSIANSPLWLNRLTSLNTPAKPVTVKSMAADYGSTITVGGDDAVGTLAATDSMKLGFGSRLKMDVYSDGLKCDQINTAKLIVEKKDWNYGPDYKQPVIEFNCHFAAGEETLAEGRYVLGTVSAVDGDVANLKIEGISKVKSTLAIEDGYLVLNIMGTRSPVDIEWNGTVSTAWDVATTENFVTHDAERASESFIEGDNVYFTDETQNTTVTIADGIEVKPSNIYYTASKNYTVGGGGKIVSGTFHNNGMGAITMNNDNTYTGGNHLAGGTTIVSSLSSNTQPHGNLGGVTARASDFTIENGAILQNSAAVTNGSPMQIAGKGILRTDAAFAQQAAISGDTLVKEGRGTLSMSGRLSAVRTIVKEGGMNYSGSNYTKVVELQGSSTISGDGFIAAPIYVAKGAKATMTLTNTYYQAYSGALTGSGQLTINPTNTVNRVAITGNWSNFEGTIVYNNTSILMPLKNSGMPKATLSTGANTNIGIATSGNSASVTYPIGKLTGAGTLRHKEVNFSNSSSVSGSVTWKVGSSDLGDFTFSGVIYDEGGGNKANFEKVGDCTMTVAGAWQNSGTVKVTEGWLAVNQGKTLGTGALTVAAGGTLTGMSSTIRAASRNRGFTNSSVTIDGALRTGATGASTSGYWYFGTCPLTFGRTGKLYVGVSGCATSATAPGCTHIWGDETNGAVTFEDGATISVYLAPSYDPVASIGTDEAKADSFCVFSFAKARVGDVRFELPELPEHYYWETGRFKDGYLFIRYHVTVGLEDMAGDKMVNVDVFEMNGIAVASYVVPLSMVMDEFYRQPLPRGVYVLRIRDEKKTIVANKLCQKN
jgi:hypothetical protein